MNIASIGSTALSATESERKMKSKKRTRVYQISYSYYNGMISSFVFWRRAAGQRRKPKTHYPTPASLERIKRLIKIK